MKLYIAGIDNFALVSIFWVAEFWLALIWLSLLLKIHHSSLTKHT